MSGWFKTGNSKTTKTLFTLQSCALNAGFHFGEKIWWGKLQYHFQISKGSKEFLTSIGTDLYVGKICSL